MGDGSIVVHMGDTSIVVDRLRAGSSLSTSESPSPGYAELVGWLLACSTLNTLPSADCHNSTSSTSAQDDTCTSPPMGDDDGDGDDHLDEDEGEGDDPVGV